MKRETRVVLFDALMAARKGGEAYTDAHISDVVNQIDDLCTAEFWVEKSVMMQQIGEMEGKERESRETIFELEKEISAMTKTIAYVQQAHELQIEKMQSELNAAEQRISDRDEKISEQSELIEKTIKKLKGFEQSVNEAANLTVGIRENHNVVICGFKNEINMLKKQIDDLLDKKKEKEKRQEIHRKFMLLSGLLASGNFDDYLQP